MSRWKPWDLATRVGTVDRLSNGRAITPARPTSIRRSRRFSDRDRRSGWWVPMSSVAIGSRRWTAARWDGLLPQVIDPTGRDKPTDIERFAEIVDLVRARRSEAGRDGSPYDVIVEADSTGEFVRLEPNRPDAWADAGATWWVESWWTIEPGPDGRAEIERRVAAGPPG